MNEFENQFLKVPTNQLIFNLNKMGSMPSHATQSFAQPLPSHQQNPSLGQPVDTRKMTYTQPELQFIDQTGTLNTKPNDTMDPGSYVYNIGKTFANDPSEFAKAPFDLVMMPTADLINKAGAGIAGIAGGIGDYSATGDFDSAVQAANDARMNYQPPEGWARDIQNRPKSKAVEKLFEPINTVVQAGSSALEDKPFAQMMYNIGSEALMDLGMGASGVKMMPKIIPGLTVELVKKSPREIIDAIKQIDSPTPEQLQLRRESAQKAEKNLEKLGLKIGPNLTDNQIFFGLTDMNGKPIISERWDSGVMVKENPGIKAYLIDEPGSTPYYTIGSVFLPPEFRGTDIGTELYRRVIDTAHALGRDVANDPYGTSHEALYQYKKLNDQGYPINVNKDALEITSTNATSAEWNKNGSESISAITSPWDFDPNRLRAAAIPAAGATLGYFLGDDETKGVMAGLAMGTIGGKPKFYSKLKSSLGEIVPEGKVISASADVKLAGNPGKTIKVPVSEQYPTGEKIIPAMEGKVVPGKSVDVLFTELAKKIPDITDAELRSTGVLDYLRDKKQLVNRELKTGEAEAGIASVKDVEALIDQNSVKLGEDSYGDNPYKQLYNEADGQRIMTLKKIRDKIVESDRTNGVETFPSEAMDFVKLQAGSNFKHIRETYPELSGLFDKYNEVNNKAVELFDKRNEASNKEPQFSGYKPITSDGVPGSYVEKFVTAELPKTEKINNAAGQRLGYPEKEMVEKAPWRDEHTQYSETKNPMVRIRYDIKEYPDGRKTLRIHEIQEPKQVNIDAASNESLAKNRYHAEYGTNAPEWNTLDQGTKDRYLSQVKRTVPQELASRAMDMGIKQAIADAKEQGLDGIEWATGEQTRTIYDNALRNVADEARWHPETEKLTMYKGGMESSRANSEIPSRVPREKLEDYIGKSGAERLLKSKIAAEKPIDFSKFKTMEEADNAYENIPTPERYYNSVMQNGDFNSWGIYDRRTNLPYSNRKPLEWQPADVSLGFDSWQVREGAEFYPDGELSYNIVPDKFSTGIKWSIEDQDGQPLVENMFATKAEAKQFVEDKFNNINNININTNTEHIATDLSIDKRWPAKLYGDFKEGPADKFGIYEPNGNPLFGPFDTLKEATEYRDQFHPEGKIGPEVDIEGPKGEFDYNATVPRLLKKHGKGEFDVAGEAKKYEIMADQINPRTGEPSSFMVVDYTDGAPNYGEILGEGFTSEAAAKRFIDAETGSLEKQPAMWFTDQTPSSFPIYEGVTGIAQMLSEQIKKEGGGAKGAAIVAAKYGIPAALLAKYLISDDEGKKKVMQMSPAFGVVKLVGYHGGPKGLKQLKPVEGGNGAVYFARKPSKAKFYAENVEMNEGPGSSEVYAGAVNSQKPQYRPSTMVEGKRSVISITHDEAADLVKQGYDSVIGIHPKTGKIEEFAILPNGKIELLKNKNDYNKWKNTK